MDRKSIHLSDPVPGSPNLLLLFGLPPLHQLLNQLIQILNYGEFLNFGTNGTSAFLIEALTRGRGLRLGKALMRGRSRLKGLILRQMKLRGGMSLTLKNSNKSVLPVPSGQPVKKPSKSQRVVTAPRLPSPGARPRTITIPARVNSPPKK